MFKFTCDQLSVPQRFFSCILQRFDLQFSERSIGALQNSSNFSTVAVLHIKILSNVHQCSLFSESFAWFRYVSFRENNIIRSVYLLIWDILSLGGFVNTLGMELLPSLRRDLL